MYHLQSLGGASLQDPSGEIVRFRSRKHLSLLLYITANGARVHTRRELAALLWDSAPERARHSLSQALYDVRRQLDGAFLTGPGDELRLDRKRITYDAEELEAALKRGDVERAVGLCNGPFASNLQSSGTEDFERWLEAERVRLSRLSLVALRRYVQQCDSRGLWGDMCVAALKLVEADALDEHAHRVLMRGLWLHGDRESALQHFEETAAFLEAELPEGISAETRALVERIRARPAESHSDDGDADTDLPLIGREDELEFLRTRVRSVERAGGSTIVVEGHGGIGKSRLLKAFGRSLGVEPVQYLESRCYPAEADIPYGPIVDGMRPIAARIARELPSDHSGFKRLGHLFAEFSDFVQAEDVEGLDPEAWRRRLYEEVTDLLKLGAALEPIVWVVEDTQWIDTTSASLLHYIARRLADHRLLLVVTFRTSREEKPDASPAPVSGYVEGGRSETLVLRPLTDEEIARLVLCVRPDAEGSPAVLLAQHLSGGNPFYALEVFRAAVSSADWAERAKDWDPLTDARLSQVFRIRFQELTDRSLELLQSIAVLERHATPRNLSVVSGHSLRDCAALGKDLYERGLIQDDEDRVEFVNDITREYVYGEINSLQRVALHSAAAALLSAEPDTGLATLARHHRLGGDRALAFDFGIRAAREASESGGHTEASHMASLALGASRTRDEAMEALKILADSELASAQLQSAQQHFGRILDLDPHMSLEDRITVKLRLVRALSGQSDWNKSAAMLRELGSSTRSVASCATRLDLSFEVLNWKMKVATRVNDYRAGKRIKRHTERQRAVASRNGWLSEHPNVRSLCTMAAYELFFSSAEDGLALLGRCTPFTKDLPPELKHRVQLLSGLAKMRLCRWAEAEHDSRQALETALTTNDTIHTAAALTNLACIAFEQGDWEKARELNTDTRLLHTALGSALDAKLPIQVNTANIHFYEGNARLALSEYEAALQVAKTNGVVEFVAELTACVGLVALQLGEAGLAERNWTCIEPLEEHRIMGVQERFKIEWLRAYMLRGVDPAESAARLRRVAEERKPLNRHNFLKLAWLCYLLFPDYHSSVAGFSLDELKSTMREENLAWFSALSRRWLRAAEAHRLA